MTNFLARLGQVSLRGQPIIEKGTALIDGQGGVPFIVSSHPVRYSGA